MNNEVIDNTHGEDKDFQPPVTLDAPSAEDLVSSGSSTATPKRNGRRKINIEFIEDKSRRHITFSKRKAGIMKKAYELSTLTGTQVLLLVASETGHVYTFATPKLQPLITKPEGKNLIQACLNAPDTLGQAPPSHPGAQMSPGGPYGQGDHSGMNMSQGDYGNQHSPGGPVQSPYSHPQEEEKSLPYIQQRSSYHDVKPFQDQHSMSENTSMGYSPYPNHHHMMGGNSGGGSRGLPYQNGSLPTLTDRGSFSNLPGHMPPYGGGVHNQHQQFPSNMPPYNPPSSFPSHTFPSPGSSQLFSKASNLPTIPRGHDSQQD
mmetsp:Transcript_13632/g.23294  ORF Transcript_13632/g.23294 Transcript_13632/m.23294 type:complete len:317 (-) Transcript_13632:32-982(-)